LADIDHVRKHGDIAAYRVQAFDGDKTAARLPLVSELSLQVIRRVVPEHEYVRPAQTRAVIDARVALDVEEHLVSRRAQTRDYAEICLIAGREDECVFLPVRPGEFCFQASVCCKGAVRRPGSSGAGAVALEGGPRGVEDFGMEAQAEV